MAADPQRGELSRPRTRIEDFAVVDEDGQIGDRADRQTRT